MLTAFTGVQHLVLFPRPFPARERGRRPNQKQPKTRRDFDNRGGWLPYGNKTAICGAGMGLPNLWVTKDGDAERFFAAKIQQETNKQCFLLCIQKETNINMYYI